MIRLILENFWNRTFWKRCIICFLERKLDCIVLNNGDYALYCMQFLFTRECEVYVHNKDKHLLVLLDRIELVMDTDKLFLDPGLTLDRLSRICAGNRTYMSKAFLIKGFTFKQYINTRRLNYANDIVSSSSKPIHLEDISLASGYRCSRTFLRVLEGSMGESAYRLKEVYIKK